MVSALGDVGSASTVGSAGGAVSNAYAELAAGPVLPAASVARTLKS